ncbi:MAG: GNAT family N-acetyltransferase [Velocimicrobium sp.]
MTNKEKYQLFCENNKDIPIFSCWWWMEEVTDGTWDVLLCEKNGAIVGSLVYYPINRENKTLILRPVLTQNNGIYIKYPKYIKTAKKAAIYEEIITDLLNQLEQLDIYYYEQNYHYNITNWLPMFWRGYHEITRYTYVIEDTKDLERVVSEFGASVRSSIKKAEKTVRIYDDISTEEFYNINEKTFLRQKLRTPFSYELFKHLDAACEKRGCKKVYYAKDTKGNIHGASYFVWDETSVYYLLSGGNPEYRSSQAQTLLIYEGIKLAHKLGKKFDFEGSVLPHVEPFVRRFGGVQKPYFRIWKEFL